MYGRVYDVRWFICTNCDSEAFRVRETENAEGVAHGGGGLRALGREETDARGEVVCPRNVYPYLGVGASVWVSG